MSIRVALINMKGGVGKSTITAQLAWQFSCYRKWSKRVLVVDLDPQFNASQYLLGPAKYGALVAGGQKTIWDVMEQGSASPAGGRVPRVAPADVIVNVKRFTGGGRIDLIPSRLELSWSLRNPAQKERKLTQLLNKVDDDYDLVLVDCAPTDSVLTTSAYFACQKVLIPVVPQYLSSIGLPLLARSINEFEEQNEGESVEVVGIVFNAASDYVPEEATAKGEVRAFATRESYDIFDAEIRYSRSYAKGAREGAPIFRTSYARTKVANQFHAFAVEFAGKVGL